MQIEYMRAMLTGVWMLFISALGYAASITSLVGWIALLAVALTPAVIMTRFWGAPAGTMSETIRDVLR
jgi:Cu/Ag efflux pump CusA